MVNKTTTMPTSVKVAAAAGVVGALATTAAFLMSDKKMRTKVYKIVSDYIEQGSGKIEELKKTLTEIQGDAEMSAKKTVSKAKTKVASKAKEINKILDTAQTAKSVAKAT